MGSKKKSTTTQNSTQTVAPPSWTAPGMANVAGKVDQAVGQIPGADSYYQGDFIAQPDQGTGQGIIDAYRGAASNAGNMGNFLNQEIYKGADTYNPQYTTTLPANTPYNMGDRQANLDQVISAATAPIMRQLQQQILPGIKSSALDSGAYSNDRAMAVMPQQAIDVANRNATELGLGLGYEDYNNWENRRLEAEKMDRETMLSSYGLDTDRQGQNSTLQQNYLGMLPGLTDASINSGVVQGDVLARAGDIETAMKQAGIDNNLQREQYNINRPFMGLDKAADLYRTLSGNYGTTTGNSTSTTVQKSGGLGEIAKGVAGLGMAGASLFGGGGPLSGMLGKTLGGGGLSGLNIAKRFIPGSPATLMGP